MYGLNGTELGGKKRCNVEKRGKSVYWAAKLNFSHVYHRGARSRAAGLIRRGKTAEGGKGQLGGMTPQVGPKIPADHRLEAKYRARITGRKLSSLGENAGQGKGHGSPFRFPGSVIPPP